MAEPKDLVVESKPRVIKDKLITFGKYANQNKLFSDIVVSDFTYCLDLVKDFKNYRDFHNYIMESDQMIEYEEKLEEEELKKEEELNVKGKQKVLVKGRK
jgi:hypothetical protein